MDDSTLPDGWAKVTGEDGRIEYLLVLAAPTIEEAHAMARAEARRFVLDFAQEIARWIGEPHRASAAHDEWLKLARPRPDYSAWQEAQILAIARGERTTDRPRGAK